MNKKIKINEIIVVEGRDDITAVKRVVDTHIIALNGFSGMSKNTIKKLLELSKNNDIILLTDPDFSGKKIRQKIQNSIPNIKHAFISRNNATKIKKKNSINPKINIGIENADDKSILEALKNIITIKNIETIDSKNDSTNTIFTMKDLIDNNLSIGIYAKENRIKLGDILKIGYYNSKQLLKALNNFNISRKDFERAINKINKEKIMDIGGLNDKNRKS